MPFMSHNPPRIWYTVVSRMDLIGVLVMKLVYSGAESAHCESTVIESESMGPEIEER